MESRWETVGGVQLHWAEAGQGRPAVFLHGMADTHLSWVPLAKALPGRRIILLDLPGHGLSDRPDADYTPEWYAEVVGGWWDRLGLEDVDLVGHSYGGALAQLLLLSHRERIDTLTLVAPGGHGPEVAWAIRMLQLPGVERVVQPFLGLGTRLTLASVSGQTLSREQRALAGWMSSRPDTARALVRTARAVVDLGGQTRLVCERAHEAGELPPTALLWGDRDRIVPIRHAQLATTWLHGVELRTYASCGHWPHLECTSLVARDVQTLWATFGRVPVRIALDRIPRLRPAWPVRLWHTFVTGFRKLLRPRGPRPETPRA